MALRDHVLKWLLRDSDYANPEPWLRQVLLGGTQSSSSIIVSQRTALQEAACMACTLIRSGDLAKCQVHAYQIADDGEQLILTGNAAERLLRQPNYLPDGSPWQTPFEFFEQLQIALLLKSNAFAVIIRNGRGEPVSLVPVNPDQVCLYEGSEGDVFYQVTRQTMLERALLKGMPELIPARNVLHVRGASLNGVMGLSRISMAKESLGLALAMDRTAAKLFGNGAHPTIALSTDKNITDSIFKQTKEKFRNHNQGLDNVGEMMLLGGGLKPIPVQMNMMDAQFSEIRDKLYETIAMVFDVPKHRLGLSDQGDPLKSHQMYLNNTIAGDAERIQQKLNQLFGFDGINTFVEFDLDQFNRADPATRAELSRVKVVGGLETANEYRRNEGKGPKPGGDYLWRPNNVVPADTPAMVNGGGSGPGSDTTGKPAPGGDGDPNGLPGKDIEPTHDRTLN
ncbi:MAG TPA: phage portal protein [Terriglobia bacterium]|nr:phage portal protein [Terriglobia bacterium]